MDQRAAFSIVCRSHALPGHERIGGKAVEAAQDYSWSLQLNGTNKINEPEP